MSWVRWSASKWHAVGTLPHTRCGLAFVVLNREIYDHPDAAPPDDEHAVCLTCLRALEKRNRQLERENTRKDRNQ